MSLFAPRILSPRRTGIRKTRNVAEVSATSQGFQRHPNCPCVVSFAIMSPGGFEANCNHNSVQHCAVSLRSSVKTNQLLRCGRGFGEPHPNRVLPCWVLLFPTRQDSVAIELHAV